MLKKLFCTLFMFVYAYVCAQEFTVASFENLPNDLAARTQLKTDINGDACALIKVQIPGLDNINFEGWVIDQSYTPGEYRVYVPANTKKIIIKHPDFLPLEYTFPEKIIGKMTYKMVLKVPINTDGSVTVHVKTNVLKSTLFIEDKKYETENAQFSFATKPGEYNLRLVANEDGFTPFENTIVITAGEPFQEFICNMSSQTKYNILYTAEKGTEIYVDKRLITNTKRNSFSVESGVHTIELKLGENGKWYKQLDVYGTTKDIFMDLSLMGKLTFIQPLDATFKITPIGDALPPSKKSVATGEEVRLLGDYEVVVSKKGYKTNVIAISVVPNDSDANFKATLTCKADELDSKAIYDKAYKLYSKMSTLDDDHANYKIGEYYFSGKFVKADKDRAMSYWRKSGNYGNEDAILHLVSMNIPDAEKIKYLKLIADKGSVPAQLKLADIYCYNIREKNFEKALFYYQKAAKYYPEANYNIGEMYYNGWGVNKDVKLAKTYYEKGNYVGEERCAEKLADYLYDEGKIDEACKIYESLGQIKSPTRVRLAKWYADKNQYNIAAKQLLLAKYEQLENSVGLKHFYCEVANKVYSLDKKAACNLYEIALDKLHYDFADGYYRLGMYYEKIYASNAFRFYKEGARLKDGRCMCRLGYCYETGLGVTKDVNNAVNLYKGAIEAGYKKAYRYLGTMYMNGTGVSSDPKLALKYWEIAAKDGDNGAVNLLIKYYTHKHNDEEVRKWKTYLK